MPVLWLNSDRDETRATTNGVMAAIEAFCNWWVLGPKQHDADLLLNLGSVSSVIVGERSGKRS